MTGLAEAEEFQVETEAGEFEDFDEWVRTPDQAVIMRCRCGVQWLQGQQHHLWCCHETTRSLIMVDHHRCRGKFGVRGGGSE